MKHILYTSLILVFWVCTACSTKSNQPPAFKAGVHVVNNFFMPQFNYSRDIWVYLPPDYQNSTRHYPVLYMQDGQNLFEDSASFVGEWRVDETLDSLHTSGDYGCIVVGVANGGERRMAEYMPNTHPKYGGGDGALYVDFLINALKPYVDSVYRTKPEARFTGIGGSSLGGLISYYAAQNNPQVFGNALIMSPSFWIDSSYVNWRSYQGHPKTYFVAGEFEDDSDVRLKIRALKAIWFQLGYKGFLEHYPADGEHTEWFWAREFGPAYLWLFDEQKHNE